MEGAIFGGKLAAEVVACKAAGEATKAGSESELLPSYNWGLIEATTQKNADHIHIYIYET